VAGGERGAADVDYDKLFGFKVLGCCGDLLGRANSAGRWVQKQRLARDASGRLWQ